MLGDEEFPELGGLELLLPVDDPDPLVVLELGGLEELDPEAPLAGGVEALPEPLADGVEEVDDDDGLDVPDVPIVPELLEELDLPALGGGVAGEELRVGALLLVPDEPDELVPLSPQAAIMVSVPRSAPTARKRLLIQASPTEVGFGQYLAEYRADARYKSITCPGGDNSSRRRQAACYFLDKRDSFIELTLNE